MTTLQKNNSSELKADHGLTTRVGVQCSWVYWNKGRLQWPFRENTGTQWENTKEWRKYEWLHARN